MGKSITWITGLFLLLKKNTLADMVDIKISKPTILSHVNSLIQKRSLSKKTQKYLKILNF